MFKSYYNKAKELATDIVLWTEVAGIIIAMISRLINFISFNWALIICFILLVFCVIRIISLMKKKISQKKLEVKEIIPEEPPQEKYISVLEATTILYGATRGTTSGDNEYVAKVLKEGNLKIDSRLFLQLMYLKKLIINYGLKLYGLRHPSNRGLEAILADEYNSDFRSKWSDDLTILYTDNECNHVNFTDVCIKESELLKVIEHDKNLPNLQQVLRFR